MPISTSTRKVTARTRKSVVAKNAAQTMPAASGVCQSCHALPAGSMEVTALLLVLVFSLTAVLFTSIYTIRIQQAKVAALEAQISFEY
jgi:cytochrome c biogenesis factor